ncbi:MAG: flagellar hook capping FlgD N-terminal domain-containing protein [Acidobacteriaceae bacterium]
MQVNATSGSSSDANSSAMGLSGTNGDMFLQLLTTELKSQNPISPMDPTQFVGQLVQFNTLGELMQIRQLLDSTFSPSSTGSNSDAASGVAGDQ